MLAGRCARALARRACWPLVLGLRGDLGSGKTTWARAMLRGLGLRRPRAVADLHAARALRAAARSPSFISISIGSRGEEELENLGLRDWLAETATAGCSSSGPSARRSSQQRCDLTARVRGRVRRRPARDRSTARTRRGIEALQAVRQEAFNNDRNSLFLNDKAIENVARKS